MSQPIPPRPPADRQFTRDVARQIDRRRVRRRVTLWSALLALVAAAAAYLRCGGGFGLGDGGGELGGDGEQRPVAGPARCAIRVSAAGFTVAGRTVSRDAAVAACKTASAVDLFITGDARHGDAPELQSALSAAGVKDIAVHQAPVPATAPPEAPRGAPADSPRR